MRKDLHAKPFDEGTLKKLEIFELYTREWLPTFLMSEYETIYIFIMMALLIFTTSVTIFCIYYIFTFIM